MGVSLVYFAIAPEVRFGTLYSTAQATFLPHSRVDARSAPSRRVFELQPHDAGRDPFAAGEGAEAAVGRGDDALAVADGRDRFLDAARDHFRVLDEVRGGLDHAGDQDHVLRQRVLLERRVFVRVARVGELDRQRADRSPGRAPAGSWPARCRRCAGLPSCRSRRAAARGRAGMPSMPLLMAATCRSHALTKPLVVEVAGTSWCGPSRGRARRSAGSGRPCGSPDIPCASRAPARSR